MENATKFEALDRTAARNFAEAARSAGVRRVIYLGGLGTGEHLSPHLASRQEVGAILRSSGVPTIEFRASIVIGSGSASDELVRRLVHLPLLTPRVCRLFLGLITPVYGQVAGALVESLRNETIVRSPASVEAFGIRPRGLEGAVERALVNEDLDFAETRWSDALESMPPSRVGPIPFGRRLISSRVLLVNADARDAFDPIQRIGGHTGWYAGNWFWHARGLLDPLRGGVGLRRRRRDPVDLRAGDTIDCWRVESMEPERRLRLAAEMKIPGSSVPSIPPLRSC
jgi:uncharacterized protein DUF2867